MRLKQIIENNDTARGKVFDIVIQFLIILSLISFSIETLPDLDQKIRLILKYFEIATVLLFTLEYLLRLIVSDRKLQFIFSFYGVIDLLAILPFYITRSVDLRSIRILRLFRLIRTLKLLRFNEAVQRFRKAFEIVKEELILFLFATALLLFVTAVGIYYFENPAQPEHFKSVFHSMWWAIITLTTVGYGDFYPVTTGGKIFTSLILIIGLGIIAVPTGLIASALTQTIENEKSDI
ncbi:ion transporter [candidate division KSB1 bacterium]|nr:ion transporter [candidate division KSB1 bacterium]